MTVRWFRLDDPPFAGHTGRGVRIAVVDSGVTAGHPHVGEVSGSVRVDADIADADAVDRLGHGTAVAAAIREKAPGCELLSVKVFDRTLATSADVLARGIKWASDHGAQLINLSLATANLERAEVLRAALEHATTHNAIIVSARESDGVQWLPGSLRGAAGVLVDWECERDTLAVETDEAGQVMFRASAWPRPIPGVPRERNLSGISFSVANVTGFLARLLEGAPGAGGLEGVKLLLVARAESGGRGPSPE
ncbi:MAG: S8 family serine peptidase [Gemmatimonadales bacterium]